MTAVRLPDELPGYLDRLRPHSRPLVIYNTVISQYLKDEAPALGRVLARWAPSAGRPILWLQWEPPGDWHAPPGERSRFGWCAWTADFWQGSRHHHLNFGWVHPHGHGVLLTASRNTWQQLSVNRP